LKLSDDLLKQAEHLAGLEKQRPKQASLRRSVSAAYYGLFHHLTWEATLLFAPNADESARCAMQRWFDHAAMYNACGTFCAPGVSGPLIKLTGSTLHPEIQAVAKTFRELQQARHSADYDLMSHWTRVGAKRHIQAARDAISAWEKTKKTSQATVFAHALLNLRQVQATRV
jgi:hypothetical protein